MGPLAGVFAFKAAMIVLLALLPPAASVAATRLSLEVRERSRACAVD